MGKVSSKVGLVEALRYYMACEEASPDSDFSFVFHHCDIVETGSVKTSELSLGPEFFPEIKVNPDYIIEKANDNGQLQMKWGTEVLKHALWHLLFGHAEKRFENLVQLYGNERLQAAADLVVNQHADATVYKAVGEKLVRPKDLNLPDGETLEFYVDKLNDIPQSQWPSPVGTVKQQFSQVDVKDFISNAQVMEKLKGDMPLGIEEYIEELFAKPKVDWDYYLKLKEGYHKGKITRVDKKRLSRRCDFHYGRRTIGVLNVAFLTDTSGSMSNDTLKEVPAEIEGIAERGADVLIMHIDADVHFVQRYTPGMDMSKFFGRGGTDFSPGFEKLKELAAKGEFVADFVVYFTDGYGSAPEKEEFDTLWVLTEDGHTPEEFRKSVCNWGTVCKLKGNDCPSAAE